MHLVADLNRHEVHPLRREKNLDCILDVGLVRPHRLEDRIDLGGSDRPHAEEAELAPRDACVPLGRVTRLAVLGDVVERDETVRHRGLDDLGLDGGDRTVLELPRVLHHGGQDVRRAVGDQIHEAALERLDVRDPAGDLLDVAQRTLRLDHDAERDVAFDAHPLAKLIPRADLVLVVAHALTLREHQERELFAARDLEQDLHLTLPERMRVVVDAHAHHTVGVRGTGDALRHHLDLRDGVGARRGSILAVARDGHESARDARVHQDLVEEALLRREVVDGSQDRRHADGLSKCVLRMTSHLVLPF